MGISTEEYLRDLIYQLTLHYPEWPHSLWAAAKREGVEYKPESQKLCKRTLTTSNDTAAPKCPST